MTRNISPLAPARAGALAEQVFDALPPLMDALRRTMRRHVADGLSVPQFRCLNFVAKRPGRSLSDLAELLGVTPPTASAMTDRLVRAGWLQVDPDAADRRRIRLSLTEAGHGLLQRIETDARADLAIALSRCQSGELTAIEAGLAALTRVLAERAP